MFLYMPRGGSSHIAFYDIQTPRGLSFHYEVWLAEFAPFFCLPQGGSSVLMSARRTCNVDILVRQILIYYASRSESYAFLMSLRWILVRPYRPMKYILFCTRDAVPRSSLCQSCLFWWPNLLHSFVGSKKSLKVPRDGNLIFIGPLGILDLSCASWL